MYQLLLWTHGAFGFIGLIAAVFSVASRLIVSPHQLHVWSGRFFTVGMVGVGLTGLVIALQEGSTFLLSLAFFVLYLSAMGYRYAVNRTGDSAGWYRLVYVLLFVVFFAMTGFGGYQMSIGNGAGILMSVFGTIGMLHTFIDVRSGYGRGLSGRLRIAAHVSRMLGGTIAALTAFLLIQFQTSSLLVWLAPAAVLTPVMLYWKYLIVRGRGLHRKASRE